MAGCMTCDVPSVYRRHLSITNDRIIGTQKCMGRQDLAESGEEDKQMNLCKKAVVAAGMVPVMGAGVMATSQRVFNFLK